MSSSGACSPYECLTIRWLRKADQRDWSAQYGLGMIFQRADQVPP